MSRQAIQNYATTIEVPFLVHFTRAVNLPSIMAHGLYPIERVSEIGATPEINDEFRLDGYRNSTSVSIGFPNCQMFYRLRMDEPEMDWTILLLHPSILWLKDCAYCCHNAADARITTQPLCDLKTFEAFTGMYDEIDGWASREHQSLKAFDPTDVQAEVLVFDVIEPQYIVGAIFEKASVRDTHLPHLHGRQIFIHRKNKGMFAYRNYHRRWGG